MPVFESICSNSYDCEVEVSRFLAFIIKSVCIAGIDPIRFSIVNNKQQTRRSELDPKKSLFPPIDGSTLSISSNANFGIETYGDKMYFVFANHLEDLLLERWRKYLRYKYPHDVHAVSKQPYRILSVEYVENSIPETKADVKRLVTARYVEKNPDQVLGLLQSEINQAIVSPCLRNLLRILFGSDSVFYSDCHTRIQPLKVRT